MKERNPGRLLLSPGLTVLALIGAATLPLSSASATTVVVQHSGMCLDVRGGPQEQDDGAPLEQWHCTGATNQNWTLEDMGSGKFRMKAQSSGKCIQNVGGGLVNITGLEQSACNGSSGQLWTRQPTATLGVYAFKHVDSGRCIDVPQASQVEGELLIIYDCVAGRPNQSWAISQTEYPPPAMPLVAVHSGSCLDVTGGPQEQDDGALIEQWHCTGATNQNWTMRDAGSGQIQLVAQSSSKCIQTVGGATANATNLEQRECSSTVPAQRWIREATATPNQYRFKMAGTASCIDIKQSLLTDGTPALLYTCHDTPNQSWTIGPPPPGAEPTVEIRPGEYWELPGYPEKSPFGGLNHIWGTPDRNPFSPITDLHWVGAFWKKLNPSEGVYDFAKIEIDGSQSGAYNLNELKAAGKSALIWTILGNVDNTAAGGFHTPQWVLTKCANAGTPVKVINWHPHVDGQPDEPWGLALWEPCPRAQVVRFIKEMFSKYKTEDAVKYAYATTLNAGEFWMPPDVYRDAKAKGLTPAILQSYVNDIIDAWVFALGVKKVVWTSAGGWKLPDNGGDVETEAVDERALMTLGTQLREGNSESITADLDQPRIGQHVEVVDPPPLGAGSGTHWYLKADETIQEMGKEGMSFYGTEFEIANLAGAFNDYPYYRLAVLNMVRKGFNYAIFPSVLRTRANDTTHPDFAKLRDWFRQGAGYPINQAPDAWASLQLFYDGCYNGTHRYHNYERFLVQREHESNGRTIPSEIDKKTWPDVHYGFCTVDPAKGVTLNAVTHFARRTNHPASDFMYFDVDSRFAAPSQNRFLIAVTYLDTGNAQWELQYSTPTQNQKSTPKVLNTSPATPQIKTAIFTLSDVSFRGAFGDPTHPKDFRIFNGGSSDVTIRMVRVIRRP